MTYQTNLRIEKLLRKHFETPVLSGWDETVFKGQDIIYYEGVETGNPSGNVNNIKTIFYVEKVEDSWVNKYRKDLTYDLNDNILTIRTLPIQ